MCLYNRELKRNLIWSLFLVTVKLRASSTLWGIWKRISFWRLWWLSDRLWIYHASWELGGHGCLMVLLEIYTQCNTPPLSVQLVLFSGFFSRFSLSFFCCFIYFEITVHFKLDNLLIQKKKKQVSSFSFIKQPFLWRYSSANPINFEVAWIFHWLGTII